MEHHGILNNNTTINKDCVSSRRENLLDGGCDITSVNVTNMCYVMLQTNYVINHIGILLLEMCLVGWM